MAYAKTNGPMKSVIVKSNGRERAQRKPCDRKPSSSKKDRGTTPYKHTMKPVTRAQRLSYIRMHDPQ